MSLKELLGSEAPWSMGILNVTPDSFSDGGKFIDSATAIKHAVAMREAGAAIIDIGGESTGPGASPISAEDEWLRIKDVVAAVAPRMPVSIDTFKASVAANALAAGAQMVNDVSALRYDKDLGRVIADHDAFVVLMYSKEDDDGPHASDKVVTYSNVIETIRSFLLRAVDRALACGIQKRKIIIDPGMGRFVSDDAADSWELLTRLSELQCEELPFPLLVSASRKGFLGGAISDRDPASQLVHLLSVFKGATLIRTHRPEQFQQFMAIWKTMAGDSPSPS